MLSWLPEDVSTFGGEIDFLFYLIYYITGAAFILVTALMIIFLVMYREREGRRATYTHGNTALEITWTVIPAIVFISLSFMSVSSWGSIRTHAPPSDFDLQVSAKQFNWEVPYPGAARECETAE